MFLLQGTKLISNDCDIIYRLYGVYKSLTSGYQATDIISWCVPDYQSTLSDTRTIIYLQYSCCFMSFGSLVVGCVLFFTQSRAIQARGRCGLKNILKEKLARCLLFKPGHYLAYPACLVLALLKHNITFPSRVSSQHQLQGMYIEVLYPHRGCTEDSK